MARPREFELDDALEIALAQFWMHGYADTSMSDLQKATGLGRQSLYNTFGNKDGIFREALALYLRRNRAMVSRLLVPEDGLTAIENYLKATAESVGKSPRRACFLFNTCVELGPHDSEVRERLDANLSNMRNGFQRCLESASERGELRSNADLSQLAAFLVVQAAGLATLARAGMSTADLVAAAECAVAALT